MNTPFFSILIPVYGNVDYLDKCLESVIKQNCNDFEVIVCYQGDTKQESTVQDARIHSIYLEKPSSYLARIESYRKVRGKYVLFVDSDDELLDGALAVLQRTIEQNADPDIIQFGYTSTKERIKPILLKPDKNILSQDEYLSYFLSELGTYPIWRKCFKHKDIQFFDEDIFMGDDALLTLAFIKEAQKIVNIDEAIYFYRPNAKSGTANLKPKYLDDLAIFLIHSFPYRRNKREIEMGIYSFICTLFSFQRRYTARELLSLEHVRIIVNQILAYHFTTKPRFVKKLFVRTTQFKKYSLCDGLHFFMFKIMRLLKCSFSVNLQCVKEE